MEKKRPIITFLGVPDEKWEPLHPLIPVSLNTFKSTVYNESNDIIGYLYRNKKHEWYENKVNNKKWTRIIGDSDWKEILV